jgi:hypothetical protein
MWTGQSLWISWVSWRELQVSKKSYNLLAQYRGSIWSFRLFLEKLKGYKIRHESNVDMCVMLFWGTSLLPYFGLIPTNPLPSHCWVGVGNLAHMGWGSRSKYSFQVALNIQYKCFFLILCHLCGFWRKA